MVSPSPAAAPSAVGLGTWTADARPAQYDLDQDASEPREDKHIRLEAALALLCRRGERFLVLFAVSPQERYILPTQINEVYFDRLVLQCQAPSQEMDGIQSKLPTHLLDTHT